MSLGRRRQPFGEDDLEGSGRVAASTRLVPTAASGHSGISGLRATRRAILQPGDRGINLTRGRLKTSRSHRYFPVSGLCDRGREYLSAGLDINTFINTISWGTGAVAAKPSSLRIWRLRNAA